jgi:hypothetical protein
MKPAPTGHGRAAVLRRLDQIGQDARSGLGYPAVF